MDQNLISAFHPLRHGHALQRAVACWTGVPRNRRYLHDAWILQRYGSDQEFVLDLAARLPAAAYWCVTTGLCRVFTVLTQGPQPTVLADKSRGTLLSAHTWWPCHFPPRLWSLHLPPPATAGRALVINLPDRKLLDMSGALCVV